MPTASRVRRSRNIPSPATRERVASAASRVRVFAAVEPSENRPSPSQPCGLGPSLSRVAGEGLFAAVLLLVTMLPAMAETPGLGRPATTQEIAAWDISIPPSGEGLPPGSGTPAQGAAIYAERCALCHGERGAGKPNDALVGARPAKTVGNYWPYATTLFDYIRRAMPLPAPQSLTDAETYALTAYILQLNGIVAEDAVLDAATLPHIRMPNRDNFIRLDGARP